MADATVQQVLSYALIPEGAIDDDKITSTLGIAKVRLTKDRIADDDPRFEVLHILATCHILFSEGIINKPLNRSGGDISESYDSAGGNAYIGKSPFESQYILLRDEDPFTFIK